MTNLKLNETPIRTAKNYGINNIKLENINVPENISEFNGLKIKGVPNNGKITLKENICKNDFTYGNGDILSRQIEEKSNKNLCVEINEKLDEELFLDFEFSKDNTNLVENILIKADENTKGTIIIRFTSKEEKEYYHNGQIKIIAEKNAKLNIVLVNLLNNKTNHFLAIENIIKENAEVKYVTAEFGGKNTIINYYTCLKETGANNEINTIYLGGQDQIIDLN